MDQHHLLRERRKEWKRGRRIKKAEKMATMSKTIKQEDGFVCPRRSIVSKRHDPTRASSSQRAQISWQQCLREWIETDEKSCQGCIESAKVQLPMLKSIDELFSLTSRETLSIDHDSESLVRYSKVCSLLNYPHGKAVLFRQEGRGAIGVSVDEKVQSYPFAFGIAMSESQVRMAEKRSIFMEKLKSNEEKYDNSLGRMSQISKELAFAYRAYLQQRSQVLSCLHSLKGKTTVQTPVKSEAASRYTRLLVRKNLRHTFESTDLDCLNYFKMREYVESDRVHEFQNITSFEQLATFILKRKPKRGRKLALATACSVCFSDYYELSNPLRACSVCGLRAHELCYSFQNTRCGYCTYQKMQRQVKELVSWCVICRKPGLMVVKIDQSHYAHGFCLLVHGLWSCQGNGNFGQTCSASKEAEFLQPCKETLWSKNTKVIEYSNPLYDSNFKVNNSCGLETDGHAILEYQHQDKFESSNHLQINDLRSFVERNAYNNISFEDFEDKISRQKQRKQGCQQCGQHFLKDYFVTCQICGQQYHALCAFLSGCKMNFDEGKSEESKNILKVICCEGESSKIGWNRRFKLNYNRCVFGLVPQDVEDRQTTVLWEE